MKNGTHPFTGRYVWSMLVVWTLSLGIGSISILWAENPSNPENGKAIYLRTCVACHGPQGKGDGPAGKALTPPPANFTSESFKKKADKDLLETIQNGKPGTGMPPWKNALSSEEIRDVLAFIRSLS